MNKKLMSEEEIKNRWMAAILNFDWKKENVSGKNSAQEEEDE